MSENVTNTAATASDQAIAPTIEIAAHAGTCYGVQRALDMALAAAPQAGESTQSIPWVRSSITPSWYASSLRQALAWPKPWTTPQPAP